MARPFNRRQARENAAFIRLLGETGNVELAARECGLHKPTLYSRRKTHAAFATEWDAAVTYARSLMAAEPAQAARAGKGRWPDSPNAPARFKSAPSGAGFKSAAPGERRPDGAAAGAGRFKASQYKTGGGEPKVTRLKDGTLQLRLARAGGIGFRTEQAFLRAFATCGNIAMAARAVGVAPTNISARRRRCPVFKAEMEKARKIASDRLEQALYQRSKEALCANGAEDLWLEKDFAPLPAMTIDQCLMLLRLHTRRQLLGDDWGRLATRKRRGAMSSEEWAIERRIWWEGEQAQRKLDEAKRERAARRGDRYEATGNWFLPGEEVGEALAGVAPGGGPSRE